LVKHAGKSRKNRGRLSPGYRAPVLPVERDQSVIRCQPDVPVVEVVMLPYRRTSFPNDPQLCPVSLRQPIRVHSVQLGDLFLDCPDSLTLPLDVRRRGKGPRSAHPPTPEVSRGVLWSGPVVDVSPAFGHVLNDPSANEESMLVDPASQVLPSEVLRCPPLSELPLQNDDIREVIASAAHCVVSVHALDRSNRDANLIGQTFLGPGSSESSDP
jgi:hypothetical protein